ncbi:MAG: 4Fe-4S dicluster domain-containing protein [Deltaproteobacteria bacterium]|nr:4Fe-4S dicluster domain-containing protein [Deltaproteobacteria bacterium]
MSSARDSHKHLPARVAALSGQNLHLCMQCGACAGFCPMAADMDHGPRLLLHLAQVGRIEELLSSRTPWVCAACDACGVICPRGLDVPRIMEALREIYLRSGRDFAALDRLPRPTLKEAPPIALVAAFRKLTA